MKKDPIIPQYGPLYGMRVLLTGSALAGPWAARMMGDYGAEVIKIEQPGSSDSSRIIGPRHSSGILPKWDSLGRNKMGIELDLNFTRSPASREVFTDLCSQCDVWINNIPNIGKHGATDELALSANPKLIICHTTGFGLPQNGGDPGFLNRTCVDSVGQAFSGLASLNGMPDGPFITANPIMADLTTALISVAGIMAAYYSMLKTGKGQVIDNSMYEASAYSQHYTWAMILNGGGAYQRNGPISPVYFPFGYYVCGDGEWIAIGVFGETMWKRFVRMLGASEEEYSYSETGVVATSVPKKREAMDALLAQFLSSRTATEVEQILSEHRIACSRLLTAETAFTHPHWNARGNFITIRDHYNGTELHDFAAAPHFCGTPIDYSKYQAAPLVGEHTDLVLSRILGYDSEKIESLKKSGAVAASMESK